MMQKKFNTKETRRNNIKKTITRVTSLRKTQSSTMQMNFLKVKSNSQFCERIVVK